MRKLIIIFITLATFTWGCWTEKEDDKRGENNNTIVYYESGAIKEKKVIDSQGKSIWYEYYENGNVKSKSKYSNGKFIGKYFSYDSKGRIEKSLTFKHGIRHGISRVYDDGSLIQKTLEIEGEDLIHVNYDRSYSDTSIIVTSFVKRENDEFLPEGQFVTDLKGNILMDSMTYYYTIEKEYDTVRLGQDLNVKLKLHNLEQAKIAFRIGEIDSNFKYKEKPIEFYSENKELSFKVSAEKKGWNLIFGEMLVAKKIDENKNITGTKFYVFDDYYVKE